MSVKKSRQLVLEAIFKDPTASDRTIAKRTGFSQPTVTRQRHKLLDKQVYRIIAVPNLRESYEIIAISSVNAWAGKTDDRIIFAMRTATTESPILLIHRHKDVKDYCEFCVEYDVQRSYPTSAKWILKEITFNTP